MFHQSVAQKPYSTHTNALFFETFCNSVSVYTQNPSSSHGTSTKQSWTFTRARFFTAGDAIAVGMLLRLGKRRRRHTYSTNSKTSSQRRLKMPSRPKVVAARIPISGCHQNSALSYTRQQKTKRKARSERNRIR
jgi:hypothetical protein